MRSCPQSRKLFGTLLFVGVVCSGLAMLLTAYLGLWASLEQTWNTQIAHAVPFVVYPAVFLWVIALLIRHWWTLGVQTLFFVAALPALMHTFAFHPFSPRHGVASFTVMTYNADGFNEEDGKPVALLDYIRQEHPDIICFQEFTVRPEQHGYSLETFIRELPEYPYYHFHPHHTTPLLSSSGTAVFSRYPITRTEPVAYESRINSSCLYELDVEGRPLTLINNHLESNGLSDVDLHVLRSFFKLLRWEMKPLVDEIFNGKMRKAAVRRMEQARLVVEAASSAKSPVLICGDLNDTPLSPTMRFLRKSYRDAFPSAGFGLGATHRVARSGLRIDYFLHSPSLIASGYRTGKVYFSDHYPVMCTFRFRSTP